MTNFLELCTFRHSVRAYKGTPLSAEVVEYIMECVRMAPSAVNRQPWRFRLVTERAQLDLLARCYDRDWFRTAPACFIVCRDTEAEWVRLSDGKPHGDIDVAIAVEHLCLAAAEKGAGTCWVCNFDTELCRELFRLPANWEPVVLVPIGYPADGEAKPKVRNKIEY